MTNGGKVVPITKPVDFGKMIIDTGIESGKFIAPTLIGGAVAGEVGVLVGAGVGAGLMKDKKLAATLFSLIVLDTVIELVTGGEGLVPAI